jgi:hypothetical protein
MSGMQVAEKLEDPGLAFKRIGDASATMYKDCSTVVVLPTRGMLHYKVAGSLESLITPPNQKRAKLYAVGMEVGAAYNAMIKNVLADPNLSKWRYVMTVEDDNIPPPDAHIRLLESIEAGPFDAVSGIYFTKGEINMPQAYGDPAEFLRTGELNFRPRDIRECLAAGQVMPVNGIAMGCALWRLELFREIEPPWFVTVADIVPDKGLQCMTQDLYFCERAVRKGKRFGVDMRVKVGHIDVESEIVY